MSTAGMGKTSLLWTSLRHTVLSVLFFGIRREEIEGCDTPEQSRTHQPRLSHPHTSLSSASLLEPLTIVLTQGHLRLIPSDCSVNWNAIVATGVFFTSAEGTSAIESLVVRNADSSFQPTTILTSFILSYLLQHSYTYPATAT